MFYALAIATGLGMVSYGSFICALRVPVAAGAGALGSIIILGSICFAALSIFCFGMAAGLAIHT